MKKYDWSKAKAVVNAYLTALNDNHPLRLGRSWIEVQMANCGLVQDWRGWQFMESHAAWYACIIRTKSIGKVTKAESEKQSRPSGTAKTIKKLRFGRLKGSHASVLLERLLEQP